MIDYYLKTATEAEMTELLDGLENVAIDIIGEIPDVSGFHANVRAYKELTEEQIRVLSTSALSEPATPYRVWA